MEDLVKLRHLHKAQSVLHAFLVAHLAVDLILDDLLVAVDDELDVEWGLEVLSPRELPEGVLHHGELLLHEEPEANADRDIPREHLGSKLVELMDNLQEDLLLHRELLEFLPGDVHDDLLNDHRPP